MAIAYTTLFTALGKLVGGLNEWNTARGSSLTSRASTVRTQLNGIGPDLDAQLTQTVSGTVSGGEQLAQYYALTAQQTLTQAVLNDRPLPDTSPATVLSELVRQMGVDGETLAASPATVGSVTAVGSPVGNPRFVVSDLDSRTGAASDFVLPDEYLIRAVQGGHLIQGKPLDQPATAPTWPSGTGVNQVVAELDASVTSLGLDPGFEQWSGSPLAPDRWTIVTGVAGTSVVRVTDGPTGTYAMSLVGNGSDTLTVRQSVTLAPNSVYFVHALTKRTANPANTGTLTVAIRDGGGTVVGNTVSVATSAIATSWAHNVAVVVTPTDMPAETWLEIRYNGGSGDTVRLDQVAVNPLPELYAGGLRLAVVRGVTATATGDTRTLSVTRSSPTASLLRGLDRLLNLRAYTSRIPTGGSPTQADSLVS